MTEPAPATPASNVVPDNPTAPPASGEKGLQGMVLRALDSKHAYAIMLVVAIIDGSFFPVPPFAMLGPMVLAQPRKAVLYAASGTVASLFGGYIGYAMGYFMSEWVRATFGIDLDVRINRFGIDGTIREFLSGNIIMLALLASILPTPFKVVAIGAGLLQIDLLSFTIAAIFGRSSRMFGFCLTVAYARDFAIKRFKIRRAPAPTQA